MARSYNNRNFTRTTLYDEQPPVDSYFSGYLPFNPSDVMHLVSNGIRSVASTTRVLFVEFEGAMKTILPKLSWQERQQVNETFGEYHTLLMTTLELITRTTLRVNYSRTQEDLVHAIDLQTLVRLCDIAAQLLPKFWSLNILIGEKVKDEHAIKMWRNIALGVAGLAGSVLLIGTGVGAAFGFTSAVKNVLFISGAVAVVGLSGAGIAQVAQNLSAFEQVIRSLNDIKVLLSQLSRRYSIIRGMQGDLQMNDRWAFLDILEEAKSEVDKGFEILSRL